MGTPRKTAPRWGCTRVSYLLSLEVGSPRSAIGKAIALEATEDLQEPDHWTLTCLSQCGIGGPTCGNWYIVRDLKLSCKK